MTAAERRSRERRALRTRILQAARELFVRHGVEAVTMRRIADSVEYTPPVLYSHFRDKADLLRALCDEDLGLFLSALQRAARVPDPVERIRRMGRQYVDFALEQPHHYRLLFMTPIPEADRAELERRKGAASDAGQQAYGLLREAVRQSIAEGRFGPAHRDAERVTQALWAAVHGLVSLWIVHSNSPHVEWRAPRPTALALIDAALDGLSAGARAGGGAG